MDLLEANNLNFGDVGASYLMKCLSNIKELDASDCGISPKMEMKLRKRAREEGCIFHCE